MATGIGMKVISRKDKKKLSKSKCSYQFRICLVGDCGSGKTQAFMQFIKETFSEDYVPTIGPVSDTKKVTIYSGDLFKLQVFDTAGHEMYEALKNPLLFVTHAAAIFFDVTSPESFRAVPKWIKDVREHSQEDVSIILVGTKCDLIKERAVSTEEISNLANELQLGFVEISSKTKDNLHRMFEMMLEMILPKIKIRETGTAGKTGPGSSSCIVL